VVIDQARQPVARVTVELPTATPTSSEGQQDPAHWWLALEDCMTALRAQCDLDQIKRMAVDGTSATVLLSDINGSPATPALMYNDTRARAQAERIATVAPANSPAQGASSSLAKALWLQQHTSQKDALFIQHQADWISTRLTGRVGVSDYNNALKLGFDIEQLNWPEWIRRLADGILLLPDVVAPGDPLGPVMESVARSLGLGTDTLVVAGTTDSIAGFLASGAGEIGDGVTSLGSTLVLKLLSDRPVFSARHGVYSHRLGSAWLVGGASNSGGAVLKQFFTDDQITRLTQTLNPEQPTGLHYYPLASEGERFPVADPDLKPRISPIPDDPAVLFQALLEGITAIEQRGYTLLSELGAPPVRRVFTTGGGSVNKGWTRMRQQTLGVPITPAVSMDAAYGAALLARGSE
jgi:sugar (pentulose or hexulose) kinase